MSLEKASEERKARLAALREKRHGKQEAGGEPQQPPRIISRNLDSATKTPISSFESEQIKLVLESGETVVPIGSKQETQILKKLSEQYHVSGSADLDEEMDSKNENEQEVPVLQEYQATLEKYEQELEQQTKRRIREMKKSVT